MRIRVFALIFLISLPAIAQNAANAQQLQERQERAFSTFHDGLLLLHANSTLSMTEDGFRQNPFFYYFTGLENTPGALFALDGRTKETWLFLPSRVPFTMGMTPEVTAGTASAGAQHVVDWAQLESFLADRAREAVPLYFVEDTFSAADLPPGMQAEGKHGVVPAWVSTIVKKFPAFSPQDASNKLYYLSAVESGAEIPASRKAASATVSAFYAGLRAIHPGKTQRLVESTIENECWRAGAHGSSFWPWVMSGPNAVFPRPFWSMARYDHLDRVMKPGELVRLDLGCEAEHYGGDLGRTVPVSGHYTNEQREIWNALVSAYKASAKTFREGVSEEQVYATWRAELLRQKPATKYALTRRAIDLWVDRKNVPFWQMHTMNLDAGFIEGPLRAGMVIDFEPIVSIDDLGFYLEDMYLIGKDGAEDLTPGVPFTADEIEAAMGGVGARKR